MNPTQNQPDNELGPEHFLSQNFGLRPASSEAATSTVPTPSTNNSTTAAQFTINPMLPSNPNTASSTLDLDELIRASSFNVGGQQNTTQFNADDYVPRPYQKPKVAQRPPLKKGFWPRRRRRRRARYSEGVIYYQIAYLTVAIGAFAFGLVSVGSDIANKNLFEQLPHNGIVTQAEVTETDEITYFIMPFIHFYDVSFDYTANGYNYSHQSVTNEGVYNSANSGASLTVRYSPYNSTIVEIVADPNDDLDNLNFNIGRDWVLMLGGLAVTIWMIIDISRNIHSKIKR